LAASGRHYTWRTVEKDSLKATDFVGGSDLKYEINGDQGKLKNPSGKRRRVHRGASRRLAARPALN
jgi:hypothetical protein